MAEGLDVVQNLHRPGFEKYKFSFTRCGMKVSFFAILLSDSEVSQTWRV